MEVDNKIRKVGEHLASPSQGWLMLWAQYENKHDWSMEITFDQRLREELLKMAGKEVGRHFEWREGSSVVTFMFEFTRQLINIAPLDIRTGGGILRGIVKLE